MGSLWDVYNQLTETDEELEKAAALEAVEEFIESEGSDVDEDLLKTAAEYDAAGRIMARGFMEEMIKSAMAEEEAEKKEEKGKGEEEEEEEGKDKKKKEKSLPPWMAEKKAAYLQAMREDPEYRDQLIAYFSETE
jgi:hypothetical protein